MDAEIYKYVLNRKYDLSLKPDKQKIILFILKNKYKKYGRM